MSMTVTSCRACAGTDLSAVLSLGMSPIANRLVRPGETADEAWYPLGIVRCQGCSLIQCSHEIPREEIFEQSYPYLSSASDTVVQHGVAHARSLQTTHSLDSNSRVVEIACNDGYILAEFAAAGIGVLGVEPSPIPANAAKDRGVPVLEAFFGDDLAHHIRDEHGPADVVIANNVMAHVPDLADFVSGLATLVSDHGVITVENAYVADLVDTGAFDTIYHEHYCYFSCLAVDALVRRHGLFLRRIEHFPDLHGGSMRWTLTKQDAPEPSVELYLARERRVGLDGPDYYRHFSRRVRDIQRALAGLLTDLATQGHRIAAYGAAAKGATLLNTTPLAPGLIEYVVDRNPHKHGHLLPGVHTPIVGLDRLEEDPPDHLLLLAWNHAEELWRQLAPFRATGGRLIVPVPAPRILAAECNFRRLSGTSA